MNTFLYINKNGDEVEVTQDHLDRAVQLKIELQKLHGARTPWRKLVTMMKQDGFDGAEASENYRQLVKRHQSRLGKLPSVAKYAEFQSSKKLESIKQHLGELSTLKQDAQNYTREFNRIKRELQNQSLLAEEIGNAIAYHKFDFSDINVKNINEESEGNVLVSVLSDWHVGAIVDNNLNTYNYEVAKSMIDYLASSVVKEANRQKADKLYVVSVGDLVEQITMRYAQAVGVEFAFSEQIVRAQELVLRYLLALRANGYSGRLFFTGIAGNHDRIEADKNKNVYGDTVASIINYFIKSLIDSSEFPVEYIEPDSIYRTKITINGENYKFIHGDLDNLFDENLIGKFSQLDECNYRAVIGGHVHHKSIKEVGHGKYNIVMPSLKGFDDYSERLKKASLKSQGLLIIDKNGLVKDIKYIDLEPENIYEE